MSNTLNAPSGDYRVVRNLFDRPAFVVFVSSPGRVRPRKPESTAPATPLQSDAVPAQVGNRTFCDAVAS
jgi:hypothetical protein